jgi:hypothetical protein
MGLVIGLGLLACIFAGLLLRAWKLCFDETKEKDDDADTV